MQESKPSFASKGKGREDAHWQLGWWDVSSMLDSTRRPLVWSKSSVIYTAHPTEPRILARHFPSSREFAIPPPASIAASLVSYEPPTVISVSPADDWLFAYFPGIGCDGVACLWRRSAKLDSWQPTKDSWSILPGSGVVAAEWTGAEREWVVTDNNAARLPHRGPLTPNSTPILLLVTQNHQINVCCLPPYTPSFKILRGSLLQLSTAHDGQPGTVEVPSKPLVGRHICVSADIGMTYNEPSILIAMRSHVQPNPGTYHHAYNDTDLNMQLDIQSVGSSSGSQPEIWDIWGEEPCLYFCEVNLMFRATAIGVMTKPFVPVHFPGSHVTDLQFITPPPSTLSASQNTSDGPSPKRMFLAASLADFGEFNSTPKCEIVTFSFTKKDLSPPTAAPTWIENLETRRSLDDKIVGFMLPSPPRTSLLVGWLHVSGTYPSKRSKAQEVVIGRMSALTLPDLTADENWEDVPLLSNMMSGGRTVPGNVAYSPSRTLLCSIPPSISQRSAISIHALPSLRHLNVPPTAGFGLSTMAGAPPTPHQHIVRILISSIRSRRASWDVVHGLVQSSISTETIVETLSDVLITGQRLLRGVPDLWIDETLGLAFEVYAVRARQATNKENKKELIARSNIAHDICSLSACVSAFDECQEGQSYDLDAIWHLVSYSSWVIELTEDLVKTCIFVGDQLANTSVAGSVSHSTSNPNAEPSLSPPVLLYLAHPWPLSKLQAALAHVKRFRDNVASLSAKDENHQIAKDVLTDVVDCSGLDLDQLSRVLSEILQELRASNLDKLEKTLLACYPLPILYPHLQKAIDRIVKSNLVDRARLFLKPVDLVDGISRLSASDRLTKGKERDVISKGILLYRLRGSICLRCNGRSENGDMEGIVRDSSIRWRVWQRRWAMACICGGSWASIMS